MAEVVLTEDQEKCYKDLSEEERKEVAVLRAAVQVEGEIHAVQRKCKLMVDLLRTDDEIIELSSDGAWGLAYIFQEVADLLDKVDLAGSLESEGEILIVQQKCRLMVDLLGADGDAIELSSNGSWGLLYIFREVADLLDKVDLAGSLESEGEILIVQQKCRLMVDLLGADGDAIELSSNGSWGLLYIFREMADLLFTLKSPSLLDGVAPAKSLG